jgi:MoxR-like ATPase
VQPEPVATVAQILQARQAVQAIAMQDTLLDYLLALVRQSRQQPDLSLGASPRAAVAWLQASKAHAWIEGRDFATPDDVKAVAAPLLRHRLILNPDALLDGVQVETAIATLLQQVAVPR